LKLIKKAFELVNDAWFGIHEKFAVIQENSRLMIVTDAAEL